jgi:hypothetical protein
MMIHPSNRKQKKTFRNILAEAKPQTMVVRWEKALLANQIAKLATGRSRTVAYEAKTRALQNLVTSGDATVVLDSSSSYPLLSVRLTGSKKMHAIVGSIETPVLAKINIHEETDGALKNA